MTKINNEIYKYIKEIKKNLICSPSQKKLLLNDLKNSILDYVEENNINQMDAIYMQFGTPEDISKQMIANVEPQKIKKHSNIIVLLS